MKETGKIWMNGKLVPFKDAKVHVLTHALHYSTSIFEGIRCYDTPKGSAIFRLEEHVDRLFKSAKLYSMKMEYSKKEISDAIIKTVKASGLKECYIRPLAYYGYGTMGLTPTANRVDVSIACWEWKMGESKAGKFSGAKCKISSWVKIDSRSQPMQAKAASNYANAALARVEALEDGYDEAIMLNSQGKVSEGSAENIFVVRDGMIQTPPLTANILEGITRDSIIQIIEENGGFVNEKDLERDDLYSADEVFMTGTAAEVKSVAQIDRIKIGNGKIGRVTKALQKSFMDVAMGKDERFLPWLTYI
jgi:branched-chain amino acid aminotransferase